MNKNQFRQKAQDEVSDWGAGVDRLKTQVSDAATEAHHDIHRKIDAMEDRIDLGKEHLAAAATSGKEHLAAAATSGKEHLAAAAAAGEDSWESIKGRVEPAWKSVKVSVKHAADTVRRQDNKTVNAALWAGAGALLVGGLILVWNRSRA